MRERVNITIAPDLLRRVRELADREHRSFSAQIAVLLERALAEEDQARDSVEGRR